MKKFFAEFKAFVNKGNALNLAIAVVIGNAFTAITNSLVKDIITPLVGLLTGGVSMSDWKWVIREANEAEEIAELAVSYGQLLQAVFNFLVIALSIFIAVKIITNSKKFIEDKSNEIMSTLNEKETEKKLIKELKKKGVNVKDKEVLKIELEKLKQEKLAATLKEENVAPAPKPTIEVINETLLDIKTLLQKVSTTPSPNNTTDEKSDS
jgi:large conductance mechanosensitive channel